MQVREFYRGSAARASLLYFILNDLNKINPMYQFSLKAFSVVFDVAIKVAKDCLCKPTFFISASGQGQGRCKKSSEPDRLNHVHGVPIHGKRLVRMRQTDLHGTDDVPDPSDKQRDQSGRAGLLAQVNLSMQTLSYFSGSPPSRTPPRPSTSSATSAGERSRPSQRWRSSVVLTKTSRRNQRDGRALLMLSFLRRRSSPTDGKRRVLFKNSA